MHTEEIRTSVSQICGRSPILRRGLFHIMDWLTVKSWHVRRELRKWMRNAPDKAHILDAGTGFGHNAYWLSCQRDKYSVLAIDQKQSHVCSGNAFVRDTKRKNLLFRTMSIEELEADEAFDLILCTETLEKVENDESAVEHMHGALKDGGLMITTVNRKFKAKCEKGDDFSRPGYQIEEIKKMLKESGFHHVKAHFTGGKAGQWAQRLGVTLPLRLLRMSRLFLLILPFYFILAIPTAIILNWLDSHTAHLSGEGIILLARK